MATTIKNQATLNYSSGTNLLSTSSNTASVTMQGPLEVTKYSLEKAYQIGEEITYNVFIKNTSANTLAAVTVTDDLGTYELSATTNVTPLTYAGPAKIFINNSYSNEATVTISPESDLVTFAVGNLTAGSTMLLQYKAVVNEYAGAIVETSVINNIVSVTATGVNAPITSTNQLPVDSYAHVTIEKTMFPDPVVDGSSLTYTFQIKNFGTIDATDVELTDAFTTQPTITSVTIDGTPTADYSYSNGVFIYPAASSTQNYTIPKADFIQDPLTGIVSVVPGESTIVIIGTI